MKTLIWTTVTSVMLATSATAGGFGFAVPNLWFPDQADSTVTRDSRSGDVTSVLPIIKE